MLRISQLKLPAGRGQEALKDKLIKTLRIKERDLLSYEIRKHSLDARKKPELYDIYTIDVYVKQETQVLRKLKNKNITVREPETLYTLKPVGTAKLSERPVIIGTGPAGLFCGYELARMGYRPLLLERGADVDTRMRDVERFWEGGALLTESNVQFGEGGAGTFSDGKLNTLTNDTQGRNQEVLRLFVIHGAPEQILYESKPHIGTDILAKVVKNIRRSIIRMGGEVRFYTKVTDIHMSWEEVEKGTCTGSNKPVCRLDGLTVLDTETGREAFLKTSLAVLAIGHSARDTFHMLRDRSVCIEPKSFAVGVRIEHLQSLINDAQYGRDNKCKLPAASYKLTAKLPNGRGVYTFCMCPGGYVVNASSEEGRLAINGMSYSRRDGKNANSAVIVTISPKDYKEFGQTQEDVLAGVAFQRHLEEKAYLAGQGRIPVQLFEDFCKNVTRKSSRKVLPQIKGGYAWGDVRGIFPEYLAVSLEEGIREFDRKLPGYADGEAVVSGVESRTSSPVRIVRDDSFESNVKGLYPCGEGAGYAGGITSAATDGLKVAEAVSRIYRPFDIS